MTPSVQRVVEFAKRVPGFCDFTQDDQLILIKLGFFEVWLNYIAKMTTDMKLTFDDGTYLTRQQLEIMYDVSVSLSHSFHFQATTHICKRHLKHFLLLVLSLIVHLETPREEFFFLSYCVKSYDDKSMKFQYFTRYLLKTLSTALCLMNIL